MSDSKIALISASAGLVGVIAGAIITGMSSWKLASIQVEQERMRISAATALAVRSELSQKVSTFVSKDQAFFEQIRAEEPSRQNVKREAEKLSLEAVKLLPYLDGDLFVACQTMASAAYKIAIYAGTESFNSAKDDYIKSQKDFWILYLKLKRKLEVDAQVDLLSIQTMKR